MDVSRRTPKPIDQNDQLGLGIHPHPGNISGPSCHAGSGWKKFREKDRFSACDAGHERERYLVAMLGEETNWVRNVKAAGGRARLRHGISEQVILQEVGASQRAPILKAYLQLAPGARPHVPISRDAPVSEFEKIASKYPVFKLDKII